MNILFLILCAFGFLLYLANRIDRRIMRMEHRIMEKFVNIERHLEGNIERHVEGGMDEEHPESESES